MEIIAFLFLKAEIDLEESIENHARLAQAQVQVEAHRASLHIHEMLEMYKLEDAFRRRSEGQKKRWARFHQYNQGEK